MQTITKPGANVSTDLAVPSDLLDLYFAELGKVRLLTAEDEVRLAKQIEAGHDAEALLAEASESLTDERRAELERLIRDGQAAFDHFIAANLRLVVSVASKFTRRSRLSLDELIQEGNLGLIRAVEKFDWRRGYKFSTYATWWIRQAIQRGVAASETTIRLPVAVHDALVKIRAARSRLESELGHEPSIDDLAEATRLEPDKVRHALGSEHGMASLDRRVGYDSEDAELGDFVAVSDEDPAEEVVERQFLSGLFDLARERLDDRSWYVLQRRFGLDGLDVATLDVLGKELGLSRESVRKIEIRALNELKVALAA